MSRYCMNCGVRMAGDRALTIQDLHSLYLDWTNHWMTVEKFAEYYDLTQEQAQDIITMGHKVHEQYVIWCKAMEAHSGQ